MRLPALPARWLVWWAALACMVVVFYVFAYVPTTREAAALSARLGTQRADVLHLRAEARRERELEGQIAQLRSAIRTFDAKLVSTRDLPLLLVQLAEVARQTGVTMTSLRPGSLEAVTAPTVGASEPRPGAADRSTPGGAVGLLRVHSTTSSTPTGYQRMRIEFEAKGTLAATTEFLQALQDIPAFVVLSEIRITMPASQTGQNPSDPLLSLAVTATAYFQPGGEVAP